MSPSRTSLSSRATARWRLCSTAKGTANEGEPLAASRGLRDLPGVCSLHFLMQNCFSQVESLEPLSTACTGYPGMFRDVVFTHIFHSHRIPFFFADEISCMTPRYYRKNQTAVMEGAGDPGHPEERTVLSTQGGKCRPGGLA